MKNTLGETFEKLEHNYIGLKPRDGSGIYMTGYVLMWLAQIVVLMIAMITNAGTESIWINFAISFGNQFAFFVAPLLYCKATARPVFAPLKLRKGINIQQIAIICCLAVFCIIAMNPIAQAFTAFMRWTGYTYEMNIPALTSVGMLLLSIVFSAVLPAIGEEFLFRGGLARGLKSRSYLFAIILSGFMFAIFHGNALQLVHQFVFGMVIAFTYFATGSIYSAILLHFLNNFLVLVLEYFKVGLPTIASSATLNIVLQVAMVIIGFIAVYICLRGLIRVSKKRAGIETGKFDIKQGFMDFGKTFTPKGFKSNWRKINASLQLTFDDPTDSVVEKVEQKDYADVENDEMRKLLIESDKQAKHKAKIRDRNITALAVALVGIVWIFNLIKSYAS